MKELRHFTSCDLQSRPKMRWWLPGAFISDKELEKKIIDMKEAGFGGAEILYFMGIPTKEVNQESYSEYYFGSKMWNERMKHALKVATRLDFKLDFTIGPMWPIASPAISDENDQRASWGLHVGTIDFETGFEGLLPISNTLEEEKPYQVLGVSIAKKIEVDDTIYQLNSCLNITEHVDIENKQANFELSQILEAFNKKELLTGETWTLFVYYMQRTGQKNISTNTPIIDHLSKEGTLAVIDYWEEVLMGDEEIRSLYEKNAGDLFCDSIEVNATMLSGMYAGDPLPVILWTPRFLESFKHKRGYDLLPYLQCLYIKGLYQHAVDKNLDQGSVYSFEEKEVNRQIQNDYYQTLTELLIENHIAILQEWANSHNMDLRYQVYGLPTEMTSSLHYVDVPESESLGFEDCIESNLLLSGAVHMEKKPIYSYELGAQPLKAYQHMWTKEKGLLWQMHQAMAGGINQVVLHGMSYNSQSVSQEMEPYFKWPGLSLMGSQFSNEWGDRQPIWEHASMMTAYITRLQWILRQGKPRVDLAIYRQEYEGANYSMNKDINPLSKAGYSYEFISSFLLSQYCDKVDKETEQVFWDKEGPAYKALVVDYQINREDNTLMQPFLTLKDIEHMIKLSQKGFAIFWTIGQPQFSASYQKRNEIKLMKKAYERLIELPTVYLVPREALIQSLLEKRILPDRATDLTSNLIHIRRSCEHMDYYYIYNQNGSKTVKETFSLTGNGKPYLLNCWNGKIHKLDKYTVEEDRITLQLTLVPNELVAIGIGDLGEDFADVLYDDISFKELIIREWELSVKSYCPGKEPYETEYKEIECGQVPLVSWSQIEGLSNISGIGTYKSKFSLENNISRCLLSFEDAVDTVKVIVNGKVFFPNQITKEVEITEGICEGDNEILIEIATTLNNALYARGDKEERQDYGLFGSVKLRYIEE